MSELIKPTLMIFHKDSDNELLKIYDKVKIKLINRANFVKINILTNQKIAATFKVDEIPTLLAFSDGKEFWRFSGCFSEDIIFQNFENVLQTED